MRKYNRSKHLINVILSVVKNPTLFHLLIILLIGFTLRTFGLDWDQGFYLHPDERFLAMVTTALRIPVSIGTYFDPVVSPLNPYNNNFAFFVYGRFPIILVRVLMELFQMTSYFDVRLVGRVISALADTSVIGAIYLIGRRLLKGGTLQTHQSRFPLYAALSYAVFVFPIQQAHFFTTDSIVNTFAMWGVFFALFGNPVLTGIMVGLGIASKISFLYILPLITGLLIIPKCQRIRTILYFLLMIIVSYFVLRVADPYLFQSGNFFDARVSKQFLSNLDQLKSLASPKAFYPPSIQWLSKDMWFPLRNIVMYGIGPLFSVMTLLGIVKLLRCHCERLTVRKERGNLIVIALIIFWSLSFFIYQSFQFAKTMRYFLFLYPFIALLTGYFLSQFSNRLVRALLFFLAFLWTVAFMHIYVVPHSRIQASQWIYERVANNSLIAWEYWDDPLPLSVSQEKIFKQVPLDIYQLPDSKEKWKLITKKLQYVDYISLSSNRLYDSIPHVPELYPLASRYYEELFSEKRGFKKVAEITSYPTLQIGPWRIEMNDSNSEEAFTVYDHPKVLIFKRDSRETKIDL